jgi:hypothetical protein
MFWGDGGWHFEGVRLKENKNDKTIRDYEENKKDEENYMAKNLFMCLKSCAIYAAHQFLQIWPFDDHFTSRQNHYDIHRRKF